MPASPTFTTHQVVHKTVPTPAAAAYAAQGTPNPHNLFLHYDHPRLLTLDATTGTANIYEISHDHKEPRLTATIDHVPGTPPGDPYVKLTADYVIFCTSVTLDCTALSIYDIHTGKQIGSQAIDAGRTRPDSILYENGRLVLWLEDAKTAASKKAEKGKNKYYLSVFELDKKEGEFKHIADYWPPKENIETESTYDGTLVPLVLTKSNELIASHCKHPSGTTHLVKWSLADKSGKAPPTQSHHKSTRDEDHGTDAIDYAAHVFIPSTGALVVAHSQFRLGEGDSHPVTAVRSVDSSTLKVNWEVSVEHGVEDIQYNQATGLVVVASGQHVAGVTVIDGKTGKVVRTEKLRDDHDIKFVNASPDGEDIVLGYRSRKMDVISVAEFAQKGRANPRSCKLPEDVLKSTSEETSWIRQLVVGPKLVILAQATTDNFAVVQWDSSGPGPAHAA